MNRNGILNQRSWKVRKQVGVGGYISSTPHNSATSYLYFRVDWPVGEAEQHILRGVRKARWYIPCCPSCYQITWRRPDHTWVQYERRNDQLLRRERVGNENWGPWVPQEAG